MNLQSRTASAEGPKQVFPGLVLVWFAGLNVYQQVGKHQVSSKAHPLAKFHPKGIHSMRVIKTHFNLPLTKIEILMCKYPEPLTYQACGLTKTYFYCSNFAVKLKEFSTQCRSEMN